MDVKPDMIVDKEEMGSNKKFWRRKSDDLWSFKFPQEQVPDSARRRNFRSKNSVLQRRSAPGPAVLENGIRPETMISLPTRAITTSFRQAAIFNVHAPAAAFREFRPPYASVSLPIPDLDRSPAILLPSLDAASWPGG